MAQANDSITVTPGSGATVATHLANSKEHQVVMLASHTGHIEGSLPSYWLTVQDASSAASNVYFDLWNGSASNILRVRGIWAVPGLDVSAGASVSIRLDYMRTSSAGTGGTTAGYNSATIGTANITPKDSTNPALPSGVSARFDPSGGATSSSWLFSTYVFLDADSSGSQAPEINQFMNAIPQPMRGAQELILNPSEGLKVAQGTVDTAGTLGFLVEFTVE